MRRRSSPSVKITYFDKEGVRRALAEYVAELPKRRPEVRRVILFGSMASGIPVPGSDVDLLLVLSTSDKPFLQRMGDYMPERFPVGVDVFAYTEGELEKMLAEGNWFVRRALREGEVLFEKAA